ncbi:glycosyltransferase [Filomicrobium sp.]|uniref:glycosyltransferase n=1 Tax=Filomicrobium sp. TaxID=2024831 RepID=UPI00258697A2|nr:glycosyltransferase [Filomicrobium sp.]MCV0371359.1 glycosyltransferase [Filomicrobium sp.]
MRPQISLVMPTLNAERFIAKALDSVPRALVNVNFEVVIADGGSDDATRSIAADYPFVRILDGTDRGLYDGLNRAIGEAKAEYVALLNSDDVLHGFGLSKLFNALDLHKSADMIMGGVSCGPVFDDSGVIYSQTKLSLPGLAFGIPAINARLFRASVFHMVGPFRTDLGVGADREFLVRVLLKGVRGMGVRVPTYHYRTHAGSLTLAGDRDARDRIWRSDIEVLGTILKTPVLSAQQRRTVAQALSLLRAKQLRSGTRSGNAGQRDKHTLSLEDCARLPMALARWLQWRGKLAGY